LDRRQPVAHRSAAAAERRTHPAAGGMPG
jgi:hypothetical protein